VDKLPSGQPVIILHGVLKDWFEAKNLSAHITVTDESEYAASFCLVETLHPAPSAPEHSAT
jgi:phosphopantetheinyl transferase (holo-ACP synthase)